MIRLFNLVKQKLSGPSRSLLSKDLSLYDAKATEYMKRHSIVAARGQVDGNQNAKQRVQLDLEDPLEFWISMVSDL